MVLCERSSIIETAQSAAFLQNAVLTASEFRRMIGLENITAESVHKCTYSTVEFHGACAGTDPDR